MNTRKCKTNVVIPKNVRPVKVSISKRVRRTRLGSISFWKPLTVDELARLQGIKPVRKLEDIVGGWPEGEEDDGFEKAVAEWRKADVERKR